MKQLNHALLLSQSRYAISVVMPSIVVLNAPPGMLPVDLVINGLTPTMPASLGVLRKDKAHRLVPTDRDTYGGS